MAQKLNILYVVLFFTILVRIFAMFTIPLTDTTEARYAHVAYLMVTSNNWLSVFYDVGYPFWGKPPFSFWAEALSYKIFGINDFAPRLPSLIFTFFTMGLIYSYLKSFYHKVTALWGMIIYFTFLLTFSLSGVVITDPYFTFATTLSMISFFMVLKNRQRYWQYLFFISLALGLLTKGPLALVLVGGAITLWLLFDFKERFSELKKFPWIKGIFLTLLLSLPWYVLAELETPGFLNYFIVGEHFKRFIDSGWNGDLYGLAHKKVHGMVWILWLQAAFPWGLLALYLIIKNMLSKDKIRNTFHLLRDNNEVNYFVIWSMFTMIFFTLSGNVLVTYILPALPALAILLAIYLAESEYNIRFKGYNLLYLYALLLPITFIIANIYLINTPNKLRTEKQMVEYYNAIETEKGELYYLLDRPFSAQYYSQDNAILVLYKSQKSRQFHKIIDFESFKNQIADSTVKNYVAIVKEGVIPMKSELNREMKKVFENGRFIMFEI